MDILVVGGGGREAAIIWKLAQSPRTGRLYCAPGNAGIADLAECIPVQASDVAGIVKAARSIRADFVFVAPDDPLALGLVDRLEAAGIPAFGPTAAAAQIESSKSYAKALMKEMNIPTAGCKVFTDMEAALAEAASCPVPVVIKADGLALGKGVFICRTREEAERSVRWLMEEQQFGGAGRTLLFEEMLEGPELSVLAFTDGQTISLMPSARDHKRAFDGDRGPNTGGMGAVVPGAQLDDAIWRQMDQTIFRPAVEGMARRGTPFKGVLYFGLMLTVDGPKVIEFNARFGDPECQALLPLLETDLVDIMEAVREERLAELDIHWSPDSSCCLVLASGGYPETYEKGLPISGIDEVRDALVFQAGTARGADGSVVTAGGRVLGITASAPRPEDAVRLAYREAGRIYFDRMMFRTDIGRETVVR